MSIPFLNSINDNIIVYNGENLPEEIKYVTTRLILNLFNRCSSIYDSKIYRSPHCIWFILSKNICEYYVILSLKNVLSKAINKHLLIDIFRSYPSVLENFTLSNAPTLYNFNFLFNLTEHLNNISDNNQDTFDLLE